MKLFKDFLADAKAFVVSGLLVEVNLLKMLLLTKFLARIKKYLNKSFTEL